MPTPERARRWRLAAALLLALAGGSSALAGMPRMPAAAPHVPEVVPQAGERPQEGERVQVHTIEAPKLGKSGGYSLPHRARSFTHLVPVGERYACCQFMASKVETPAIQAERQIAMTHFFDAKIDMAKVKVITASSDTASRRTIDTLPAERRLDASEWKTLDDARAAFKAHAASVGGSGVIILLAHNEGGGRMHFEGRASTGELLSPELVRVAKEEGVDLLVWGCESAAEVAGGAIQKFQLKPMVVALREAFKIVDPTWGVLLNAITTTTKIEFAFDPASLGEPGGFAAKLVSSEQSRNPDFNLQAQIDQLPTVSFPNQGMVQALSQARAEAAAAAAAPVPEPDDSTSWGMVAGTAGLMLAAGGLVYRRKRRPLSLQA